MMGFSQETSSWSGFNGTTPSSGMSDVTTGANEQISCFPRSGMCDPVQSALKIQEGIADASVAEQLGKVLRIIRMMFSRLQQERSDLTEIPPIAAHAEDDGSVVLEWIFPDFRIGFNLESNPDDSGWHLVSNKRLGEIAMSRPLPRNLARMSETIAMLIEFIVASI